MITGNERPFHGGLTIRQQFAMAAMQGLTSAIWVDCTPKNCAEKAVKYADALINELNKEL